MAQQIEVSIPKPGSVVPHEQLPMPDYKIGEFVSRLSLTRMLPSGGTFNKAVAAEYLELLRGLPAFALERALNGFRNGTIGDPKWMPMPIEIKRAAEAIAIEYNRFEKMAKEEKAQVEAVSKWKRCLPHRTPEEIARVEELAKQARENLSRTVYADADEMMRKQEAYKAALRREEEVFGHLYQFGSAQKWGWQP